MKIKMVNGKIAVEKATKSKKVSDLGFAEVEAVDSLGIIRYVPENSAYSVGQKIYYGGKREEVRMAGIDVQVMNEDNIIAIAEDSDDKQSQQA